MLNLNLYKKNYFNNVLIITGVYSSGKSMLSRILSSFKNTEHVRKDLMIENLMHLAFLKKINKDLAIYLVKSILDKNFYEQLISRNANLRPEDETSIFKAKNSYELFSRIFLPRGPEIIIKHVKQNTRFVMDTHDGVMLFKFWNKVNKNFKFINIYRNPIDIVESWYRHGMGKTEKILINEMLMFSSKKNIFPIYYTEYFKNYQKTSEMDRVIKMVLYCLSHEYKNYKVFNKCLNLEFNDFAVNTEKNLKKIIKFLKAKKSNSTKLVLKEENCPRVLDENLYLNKLKKIKLLASNNIFQELMDFEKLFFRRKKNLN